MSDEPQHGNAACVHHSYSGTIAIGSTWHVRLDELPARTSRNDAPRQEPLAFAKTCPARSARRLHSAGFTGVRRGCVGNLQLVTRVGGRAHRQAVV